MPKHLIGKLLSRQTGTNKVRERKVKIKSKHLGNGAGTSSGGSKGGSAGTK